MIKIETVIKLVEVEPIKLLTKKTTFSRFAKLEIRKSGNTISVVRSKARKKFLQFFQVRQII
jgi:hypothetical protein